MVADDVVTYGEVVRWIRSEIVNEIEDALGWGTVHGTVSGYQRERRRGEKLCIRCVHAARTGMRNGTYDGND